MSRELETSAEAAVMLTKRHDPAQEAPATSVPLSGTGIRVDRIQSRERSAEQSILAPGAQNTVMPLYGFMDVGEWVEPQI